MDTGFFPSDKSIITYDLNGFQPYIKSSECKGPISAYNKKVLTNYLEKKLDQVAEINGVFYTAMNEIWKTNLKQNPLMSSLTGFILYDILTMLVERGTVITGLNSALSYIWKSPKISEAEPDLKWQVGAQAIISTMSFVGCSLVNLGFLTACFAVEFFRNDGEKHFFPNPSFHTIPGQFLIKSGDNLSLKENAYPGRHVDSKQIQKESNQYMVFDRDPDTGEVYNKLKNKVTSDDIKRMRAFSAGYQLGYYLKYCDRGEISTLINRFCYKKRSDGKEVFPDGEVITEEDFKILEAGRKILQEDSNMTMESETIGKFIELLSKHNKLPEKEFTLEAHTKYSKNDEYKKTPLCMPRGIFATTDPKNWLVKDNKGEYFLMIPEGQNIEIPQDWVEEKSGYHGYVIKDDALIETIIKEMDELKKEANNKKVINIYRRLRELRNTQSLEPYENIGRKHLGIKTVDQQELINDISKYHIDDVTKLFVIPYMREINLDKKWHWLDGKEVTADELNKLKYFTEINPQQSPYDKTIERAAKIGKIIDIVLEHVPSRPVLEKEGNWVIKFSYPNPLNNKIPDTLVSTLKGELLKFPNLYQKEKGIVKDPKDFICTEAELNNIRNCQTNIQEYAIRAEACNTEYDEKYFQDEEIKDMVIYPTISEIYKKIEDDKKKKDDKN